MKIVGGDGLSSQAWGLIPRIQEVDRLLRDHKDARETIVESYPEICFEAFADNDSLSTKHDDLRGGRAHRLSRGSRQLY